MSDNPLSQLVGAEIFEVKRYGGKSCDFFKECEPLRVLSATDAGVLVGYADDVLGMGENGGSTYEGSSFRFIRAEELDGYFVMDWTPKSRIS